MLISLASKELNESQPRTHTQIMRAGHLFPPPGVPRISILLPVIKKP